MTEQDEKLALQKLEWMSWTDQRDLTVRYMHLRKELFEDGDSRVIYDMFLSEDDVPELLRALKAVFPRKFLRCEE